MEIKDLTIRQVRAANRAIDRVRDLKQMNGTAAAGVTFSTMIMFRNAWTQNEIKGDVEAYDETVKALRKKFNRKDKKGNDLPWSASDMEKFTKEINVLLDEKSKVVLKSYPLSELLEMDDDEYLKEVNKDHPVPQEFISLLMEAGLIEDDTKK